MVLISLCHVFGLCHSFKDCAMSASLLFQEHYPNTWCKELTHLKKPWCWERLKAGGEGDGRGWEGWKASPTQWTWVCVNSGNWWWTGRSGVLQSMRLQRIRHTWETEINWTPNTPLCLLLRVVFKVILAILVSCWISWLFSIRNIC